MHCVHPDLDKTYRCNVCCHFCCYPCCLYLGDVVNVDVLDIVNDTVEVILVVVDVTAAGDGGLCNNRGTRGCTVAHVILCFFCFCCYYHYYIIFIVVVDVVVVVVVDL